MEWIAVSDKNPDRNARFLIFGQFAGCPDYVMVMGYFRTIDSAWITDANHFMKASYWAELPEPPNLDGGKWVNV